jgi:hypothetical protein
MICKGTFDSQPPIKSDYGKPRDYSGDEVMEELINEVIHKSRCECTAETQGLAKQFPSETDDPGLKQWENRSANRQAFKFSA